MHAPTLKPEPRQESKMYPGSLWKLCANKKPKLYNNNQFAKLARGYILARLGSNNSSHASSLKIDRQTLSKQFVLVWHALLEYNVEKYVCKKSSWLPIKRLLVFNHSEQKLKEQWCNLYFMDAAIFTYIWIKCFLKKAILVWYMTLK